MRAEDVARARALVGKGQLARAHPLLAAWIDLSVAPEAATFDVLEVNYLALRTMHDGGEAALRDELEQWLWRSPTREMRAHVSLGQVMQTVGLSAIKGGRPRRALRAFARALRGEKLSRTGRVMLIESATDALSELGRHETARALALREISRGPHPKMDWLYLRRAALSSVALGDAVAATEYARRCLAHACFPEALRSEIEPLIVTDSGGPSGS